MRKRIIIWIVLSIFALLCPVYYFSLPEPLFEKDYATVLNDRNNRLLGARIAPDGQWRFPPADSLPEKYKVALLQFEDKYFYKHPGFNPVSLVRAAWQNMNAGKIVSGGSSISMQTIRLARKNKPRTYLEKVLEIVMATRLELRHSKEEILRLYASHAPFGGNIVGINAAAWKYFGRDPSELSWAEACLLAVLPNNPSMIHPGRNREALYHKRNLLIDVLMRTGKLDSLTAALAKSEPVPDRPEKLPELARHLLSRTVKDGYQGTILHSTIDRRLQEIVNQTVERHQQRLRANHIHNMAALVADVNTGHALAYVGNVNIEENDDYGDDVDVITAARSTGSILKPFLYASMLDEGFILPGTLVPDVPTIIDGFAPKNFSKTYVGAIPANKALAQSLNVPAVHMLRDYSYEKFHHQLCELGLSTINQPPSHYGLSLILGGAEATLWDLTGAYASMARTLNNYFMYPAPKRYNRKDFHPLQFIYNDSQEIQNEHSEYSALNAGALWHTFNAMLDVNRPDEESSWKLFSSSRKIAWKTGTSYGFRDAWAIGVTPGYVAAVWVGNAGGEGRPGLTGIEAAAPALFEIFNYLPRGKAWFDAPYGDMKLQRVCRESGYAASEICDQIDSVWIPARGVIAPVCPYHILTHLDRLGFRVSADCEPSEAIVHKPWFVLPPTMEWYYKSRNAGYHELPPVRPDCREAVAAVPSMQVIYPKRNSRIYVPKELNGRMGRTIFEIAHRSPSIQVFWHLDNEYIGATKRIHQMAFHPNEGDHTLTLVDENGETLKLAFEIVGK